MKVGFGCDHAGIDLKREMIEYMIEKGYECVDYGTDYDENGEISVDGVKSLVEFLIEKGVDGLYVGGSSGECIYHSVEDRKKTLEAVMEANKGRITIIAHVACNNTKDSCELARHAESLGVDAIATIPPIYFRLPEKAIAKYRNKPAGWKKQ